MAQFREKELFRRGVARERNARFHAVPGRNRQISGVESRQIEAIEVNSILDCGKCILSRRQCPADLGRTRV